MAATGGYECSQIHSVGSKYDCSICLLVLRAPHLVSCCGAHYCADCIARVRSRADSACPLCQAGNFHTMLDRGLEREIAQLVVRCPQQRDGCEWTGRVCELASHSGAGGDCGYVHAPCRWGCGGSVARKDLSCHEESDCPSRPWYLDIQDKAVLKLAEKVEKLVAENANLRERVGELAGRVATLASEKDALEECLEGTRSREDGVSVALAEVQAENAALCSNLEGLKAQVKSVISGQTAISGHTAEESLAEKVDELRSLVSSLECEFTSRLDTVSTELSATTQRSRDNSSHLTFMQQLLGVFESYSPAETLCSDPLEPPQASSPSPTDDGQPNTPSPVVANVALSSSLPTSSSSSTSNAYLTPFEVCRGSVQAAKETEC